MNYKTSKGTNEAWVEDTKIVKTGEQFKLLDRLSAQVYHLEKVLKFTILVCVPGNDVCLTKLPGKKSTS